MEVTNKCEYNVTYINNDVEYIAEAFNALISVK